MFRGSGGQNCSQSTIGESTWPVQHLVTISFFSGSVILIRLFSQSRTILSLPLVIFMMPSVQWMGITRKLIFLKQSLQSQWGTDRTGFLWNKFRQCLQNAIRNLTFSQCFMGPRMKTCAEFATDGLPFSAAVWMRLQAALLQSRNRLRKNDDTDNLSVNIRSFFRKIKSGSKRFRTILYGISPPLPAVENLRTVSHFS